MKFIFMIMMGIMFFHVNLKSAAKAYGKKDYVGLFTNVGWAVVWFFLIVVQISLAILTKITIKL